MAIIEKIQARQIFDSRGNPTVEVDIEIENDHKSKIAYARASVPSGASVGKNEAVEIRDNLAAYNGKSVTKAIENIHKIIAPAICGKNFVSVQELDAELNKLDPSMNKNKLGANAILPVSASFTKAYATLNGISLYQQFSNMLQEIAECSKETISKFSAALPTPMLNVINGGKHADNLLSIQEFMIIPTGITGISEQLRITHETIDVLRKLLKQKGFSVNVGDEGGFAPQLRQTEEALDLLCNAIKLAGYDNQIMIGLDSAASEFYSNGIYSLDNKNLTSQQLVEYYHNLIQKYPNLISIEDPFAEDDAEGWIQGTNLLSEKIKLIGDDIFVTNSAILSQGIKNSIGNGILIKPNQVGTITETIKTISTAIKANYTPIISHRSGETEDTLIAHLAVGVGSPYIKTGSLCRGERVNKYNELIRIDEALTTAKKQISTFAQNKFLC